MMQTIQAQMQMPTEYWFVTIAIVGMAVGWLLRHKGMPANLIARLNASVSPVQVQAQARVPAPATASPDFNSIVEAALQKSKDQTMQRLQAALLQAVEPPAPPVCTSGSGEMKVRVG